MTSKSRLFSSAGFVLVGLLLAVGWLATLSSSRPAMAQAGTRVIRVAPTGSDVSGCGSADGPCRSVQFAVDQAAPADEIRIASGVYTDVHTIPSLSADWVTATQVVGIGKDLTLRGGYSSVDWTAPHPITQPSTLDAHGQGRVLLIRGPCTVTLEGLRLTGGDATGLCGRNGMPAGGGAYICTATVAISGCQIYSNTALTPSDTAWTGYGGGVYLQGSRAMLQDNLFSSNAASTHGHGWGGALYLERCSNSVLVGNVITGNLGSASANGRGGGVCLQSSERMTLSGNTLESNVGTRGPDYQGGGLAVNGCNYLTLSHNDFRGNTAGGGYSLGGGLYVNASHHVTLTGTLFEANVASRSRGWGGGAYLALQGSSTLDGNVFRQNAGTSNPNNLSWGGGLHLVSQQPVTLTNNVFVCNQANSAGSAAYLMQTTALFRYTTFTKNTGGDGSALCITGSLGVAQMVNTIFAGNGVGITATAGATATLDHTLWDANDTNAGDNVAHSNDVSGNSAFAADGYHLTYQSAALNRALDIGIDTDIDGQRRPVGSGPDLGADEYVAMVFLPLLLRSAGP